MRAGAERLSESEPSPNGDASATFARFRERGAYDISAASPDELHDLVGVYRARALELPPTERAELLEQFLQLRAINQEEAMGFMGSMESGFRAAVVEFVGKTMEPKECAVLFQTYFDDLPTATQLAFIEQFTGAEPESAIMVAPFTDLARQKVEVRNAEGKLELRSILETYFDHLDTARDLIETCMASAERRDRSFPQSLTRYFSERRLGVLLPYLPQLLERDDCTRNEFDAWIGEVTQGHGAGRGFVSVSGHFGHTAVERAEWERIEHELDADLRARGKVPASAPRASYYDAFGPHRAAFDALNDAGQERVVAHLTSTWPALRQYLTPEQVRNMIVGFGEYSVPLLRAAPALQLSQEDMRAIFVQAHATGASMFNQSDASDMRACIEAGFGTEVARFIRQNIAEGGDDSYAVQQIVRNEEALTQFADADRVKLIALLNARCPSVWFRNMPYLLDHAPMPLKDFVRVMTAQPEVALTHYNELMYLCSRAEERGIPGVPTPASFTEYVRQHVRNDPQLLARWGARVDALLPAGERVRLLHEALSASAEPSTITAILSSDTATIQRLAPALRRALTSNPDRFASVAEDVYPGALLKVLSLDALLTNVQRTLGRGAYQELLDATEVVTHIIAAPHARVRTLLEYLASRGSDEEVRAFVDELGHIRSAAKQASYRGAPIPTADAVQRGKQATETMERMRDGLRQRCERDPDAVFMTRAYRIEGFGDLVRANLAAHLAVYPRTIIDLVRDPMYAQDATITDAVRRQLPTVVFALHPRLELLDVLKKLPMLATDAASIRPLLAVDSARALDGDYYATAIDTLRAYPTFACYRERLDAIASEEVRVNGVQRKPDDMIVRSEFRTLTNRVMFLLQVPWVAHRMDAYLALPEAEREAIAILCEHALSEAIAMGDTAADFAEIRADLSTAVTERYRRQFDLEGASDVYRWDALSSDALHDLATYAAAHRSPRARDVMRRCMERVLGEHFASWRAWDTDHAPTSTEEPVCLAALQEQGLLPREMTIDQYRVWLDTAQIDFHEVLEFAMPDVQHGIRRILEQAVADRHVEESVIAGDALVAAEEYRMATVPLVEVNERLKALRAKMRDPKKYRAGSGELTSEEDAEYTTRSREARERFAEHGPTIERAKARWCLSALRTVRSHELQERAVYLEKARVPFAEAFRLLAKHFGAGAPDFLHDLERLHRFVTEGSARMFGEQRTARTELRITDHVDAERYLRIGDVPVPSCQSLRSTGRYHTGVLAYAMDPNVRILQMAQEDGTLVARAVLRLLEDDDGHPQLFLERTYSTNAHPKIGDAMRSLALAKAKAMGVALHSHALEGEQEAERVGVRTLHSRGSRNTAVYTDAGGGLKRNGTYTIRSAFVIG